MSNNITYQDDGLQSYMSQQSDAELHKAVRIFSTKQSSDPEEERAFRATAKMAQEILDSRDK